MNSMAITSKNPRKEVGRPREMNQQPLDSRFPTKFSNSGTEPVVFQSVACKKIHARSPAGPISFLEFRTGLYSSLIYEHCLYDGYVDKQPMT